MAHSTPSSPTPSRSSPARRSSVDHNASGGTSPPPLPPPVAKSIPKTLWELQVPLFITHASFPNTPLVTSVPRFSYLALLLPRLAAFFGVPCSSFHHEEIQLRNLAVGLLVDLYQPTLPWRLVVGDGPEWDIGDTFLNGVKEVRFIQASPIPTYACLECGSPCTNSYPDRLPFTNSRPTSCGTATLSRSWACPRMIPPLYGTRCRTVSLILPTASVLLPAPRRHGST